MDDSLYDDPAVIRAGTAAFGLYARCGDYVARQLLDGHVPSEVATQYGTTEWIRKLVDAGLWETTDGGYFMPRYLADNPTREKVLAERKAKSERQHRWLEKQRNASSEQRRVSRRVNNPSNDASGDGIRDAYPSPFPTGRKGEGAPATRRARAPSPPPLPDEERHLYKPDGNGTCACGLPKSNRHHVEAS